MLKLVFLLMELAFHYDEPEAEFAVPVGGLFGVGVAEEDALGGGQHPTAVSIGQLPLNRPFACWTIRALR
jgi:hypothetical protein